MLWNICSALTIDNSYKVKADIKDIIPAEVFAETIDVEFEGEKFPAPAGYDAYLTCLYGDYLPEPPKEKQKTHHVYKAYKL